MSVPDKQTQLISYIEQLEENEALAVVNARVRAGDNPLTIIEDAKEGMRRVGLLYEQQQYFISGLMMAGEIFREIMEIVEPVLVQKLHGDEAGHILLGTVRGDIHDIGKNIFNIMLRCYGFTVTDLGEDVYPRTFAEKVVELRPDVIAFSGLITSSYDAMRETVQLIRALDDPALAATPVIIGGGLINEKVCAYVAADDWATDAMAGVELCRRIIDRPKD